MRKLIAAPVICLFLFFFLLSSIAHAAENEGGSSFREGNNLFSIYAYWNYPVSKLQFRQRGGAGSKMDYYYSGRYSLGEQGVKVYFWRIQLYYARSFMSSFEMFDAGDLLRLSWETGASYFQHRFAVDFYYRISKNYSFFQNNSVVSDPFLENKVMEYVFFQEPEIKLQKISGSFLFAFSRDFSLDAAMHHEVRQMKPAGSFILGASVDSNELKSQNCMIPEEHWGQYGVNGSFTRLHMISTALRLGYMYNFTWHTFFAVPEVFFGTGFQYQEGNYTGAESQTFGYVPSVRVGLTTGFNNRRAVSRFRFYADWSFGMFDKYWLILSEYRIEFLIGLHY